MKAINPIVYENLTSHQRVIATLEAMSRDDTEETARLVKTCPKRSYRMNDAAYSDKMEALQDMAMAVECDMRGCALNFFMLLYLDDHFDHKKLHDASQRIHDQIAEAISIKQAWREILEEEGINPSVIDKTFGSLRHYGIEWITGIAERLDAESSPALMNRYKEVLREYLDRC